MVKVKVRDRVSSLMFSYDFLRNTTESLLLDAVPHILFEIRLFYFNLLFLFLIIVYYVFVNITKYFKVFTPAPFFQQKSTNTCPENQDLSSYLLVSQHIQTHNFQG